MGNEKKGQNKVVRNGDQGEVVKSERGEQSEVVGNEKGEQSVIMKNGKEGQCGIVREEYFKEYEGRDQVILNKHVQSTIEEDCKAFPFQMDNHLAHVIMLAEQRIIEKEDAAEILAALLEIREKGPKTVEQKPGLTDLYSNIEEWIIARIGIETGGKLHTGRSRNDMNLTIERMYGRESILELCEAVTFLMETLLVQAEKHKYTVIPGYTHHSQHAQPVTLGHFYTSAFSGFVRDMERLFAAYGHTNICPMGGAALAATGFPVNRERVAELLGFQDIIVNSMDAASSLDFVYESACAMAIFINNVGRMTESLLLWNMQEVGLARLDLKYCSYSTIMPQKRNPVSLETLRCSGEWTYGALGAMFNAMKAYTPGNGREPGFVVSQYMEIAERITDSAYLLEGILRTLEVDGKRGLQITREGFGTMTDLADEMVKSMKLSFSAAKKITGRLVVIAHDEKIACEDVDGALVSRAARESLGMELSMPEELIRGALDPVLNVERRNVTGGPSPKQVSAMVEGGYEKLQELRDCWQTERERLGEQSAWLMEIAKRIACEADYKQNGV